MSAGDLLVCLTGTGLLAMCNTRTGEVLSRSAPHVLDTGTSQADEDTESTALGVGLTGGMVATAQSCTAVVWRIGNNGGATKHCVLQSHLNAIEVITFSLGDRRVLTLDVAGTAHVWTVQGNQLFTVALTSTSLLRNTHAPTAKVLLPGNYAMGHRRNLKPSTSMASFVTFASGNPAEEPTDPAFWEILNSDLTDAAATSRLNNPLEEARPDDTTHTPSQRAHLVLTSKQPLRPADVPDSLANAALWGTLQPDPADDATSSRFNSLEEARPGDAVLTPGDRAHLLLTSKQPLRPADIPDSPANTALWGTLQSDMADDATSLQLNSLGEARPGNAAVTASPHTHLLTGKQPPRPADIPNVAGASAQPGGLDALAAALPRAPAIIGLFSTLPRVPAKQPDDSDSTEHPAVHLDQHGLPAACVAAAGSTSGATRSELVAATEPIPQSSDRHANLESFGEVRDDGDDDSSSSQDEVGRDNVPWPVVHACFLSDDRTAVFVSENGERCFVDVLSGAQRRVEASDDGACARVMVASCRGGLAHGSALVAVHDNGQVRPFCWWTCPCFRDAMYLEYSSVYVQNSLQSWLQTGSERRSRARARLLRGSCICGHVQLSHVFCRPAEHMCRAAFGCTLRYQLRAPHIAGAVLATYMQQARNHEAAPDDGQSPLR